MTGRPCCSPPPARARRHDRLRETRADRVLSQRSPRTRTPPTPSHGAAPAPARRFRNTTILEETEAPVRSLVNTPRIPVGLVQEAHDPRSSGSLAAERRVADRRDGGQVCLPSWSQSPAPLDPTHAEHRRYLPRKSDFVRRYCRRARVAWWDSIERRHLAIRAPKNWRFLIKVDHVGRSSSLRSSGIGFAELAASVEVSGAKT
jgi:hypothetical protein